MNEISWTYQFSCENHLVDFKRKLVDHVQVWIQTLS